MAQFDIYKGQGAGAAFLLNLQDDMLEDLATRVVAPLVPSEKLGPEMQTVNPRILVQGKEYILLTHLLAAIPAKNLAEPVGSAADQRDAVIAAIDMLFTGI
jgi:toxin CcdB